MKKATHFIMGACWISHVENETNIYNILKYKEISPLYMDIHDISPSILK